MSFCQQCTVGSFCSNLGMTEPVTCPDGTYSSQLMANNINTCKICPVEYSCTAGILSQVVCSGENYYSCQRERNSFAKCLLSMSRGQRVLEIQSNTMFEKYISTSKGKHPLSQQINKKCFNGLLETCSKSQPET